MNANDLTLLCVTKGEDYALPFLADLRAVADKIGAEYLFCIDDNPKFKYGNYYRVTSNGFIESVLDECVSKCSTKYIFRIDDDEKLSPLLVEWLKAGSYRKADHWKFPRVHLWGDTEHFINAAPLYPDHQTRLSTKEKSGGRRTVHAGSPFGGGELCEYPIEHHKFLVKTGDERLKIAARYDSIKQGFGSGGMLAFNDPETFYSGWVPYMVYKDEGYTQPIDVTAALAIANEIGMHQHDGEIRPFAEWLATRKPHHVLEIGTLKGGTAALWHEVATGYVVTIDLPNGRFGGADHGYTDEAVKERNAELENRFPRFRAIAADSHNPATVGMAKDAIDDKLFDFLFIDGDHTYEGVKSDFQMYAPLVRPGGIIAFHDINDTPVHRAAGCRVDLLWKELPPHKAEFNIKGAWGGIGVTWK